MKGIDIFCTSPASTAVCLGVDSNSIGGKAIDRRNPRLIDGRRSRPCNPCTTQSPRRQKSSKANHQKNQKCSAAKQSDLMISPPGSTRYLLDDNSMYDMPPSDYGQVQAMVSMEPKRLSDYDNVKANVRFGPHQPNSNHVQEIAQFHPRKSDYDRAEALGSFEPRRCLSMKEDESYSTRSHDQVVVLRVSLHCKGCEGKVRKHISRMEGVRSFSIDFPTKKVTVIGDVTPLGVLASISKVKNAQFWPSSKPSSSSIS